MKTRKKQWYMPLIAVLFLSLSSCGINTTLVGNLNGNNTQVKLEKKNYVVKEKLSGEASATYILGIGGFYKSALINEARDNMMKDVELNGAQAIMNYTVETHVASVTPFYVKKIVTTSGYLIEYTD
ncbi:MAG: hypothetical protein LAT68_08530 [Cyclobacteriaceae bacterium]|nr:hypothetical protein [Cyclobacteriaceae bacterium]MCH8516362.1 hypothetical protein [Cyclobacteriaceae bacterium]